MLLSGAPKRLGRVDERAEATAPCPHEAVAHRQEEAGPPDVAREAEHERSPRERGRDPGQLDAVGGAADDLVQDDDVGFAARRGIRDEIGGAEGRALAEARFGGELRAWDS